MQETVKRPAVLSDNEYMDMMRDFDLASNWMQEQLGSRRGLPRPGVILGFSSSSESLRGLIEVVSQSDTTKSWETLCCEGVWGVTLGCESDESVSKSVLDETMPGEAYV